MKHNCTILSVLFCIAILASACVKDIEYNGPDGQSMLVVNCIAKEGTAPVFHLSKSMSFLEYYQSNEDFNTGVDVNISINGNAKTASYSDIAGGYIDGRNISQNDIITVIAYHPEYGTVTATDTVPYIPAFQIDSQFKQYIHKKTISEAFDDYASEFDDSKVDSSWVVDIDINDNQDRNDYYIIKMASRAFYTRISGSDTIPDTLALHFKVPTATKILVGQSDATTAILEETEEDSQFEYGSIYYIFSDQYMKESSKVSFEVLLEKPDSLYAGDPVSYQFKAQLYSVSRAYYLYHKSVNDYANADMTFMSEPVTIISNTDGGAGILATYAEKDDSIGFSRLF